MAYRVCIRTVRQFVHSYRHRSKQCIRYFCTSSNGSDGPTQPKTGFNSHISDIGHANIDYSTIYKERTGVTSGLWRLRLNQTKEGKKQNGRTSSDKLPERAPLQERPPWQSEIVVSYDFLDNQSILNEYIRFDGGVRFGRILEDMDSLAGNVAECHADNDDDYPLSFVTAAVDRIDLKRRFPLNKNLVMEGKPIYVGTSSVNVAIRVYDKKDPDFLICSASFIMVAKDGITGKTTTVNALLLDDEKAQQNFIRGRYEAQIKKEERGKRLTVIKPTSEESHLIHQFWLDANVKHRIDMQDKDKFIAINDTSLTSTTICQPQQLNRNGKIFGGHLMRIAYELARVTAYRYIGGLQNIYDNDIDHAQLISGHPQFVSSDEITFNHPVSVGCIIRNESVVACTDTMNTIIERESVDFVTTRKAMMILVRTYIQEPGSQEEILSNVFSFCYVVPNPKRPLKRVIPLTYEESMIYLQGKRALDQTTKIAIRDGSTFAQYL